MNKDKLRSLGNELTNDIHRLEMQKLELQLEMLTLTVKDVKDKLENLRSLVEEQIPSGGHPVQNLQPVPEPVNNPAGDATYFPENSASEKTFSKVDLAEDNIENKMEILSILEDQYNQSVRGPEKGQGLGRFWEDVNLILEDSDTGDDEPLKLLVEEELFFTQSEMSSADNQAFEETKEEKSEIKSEPKNELKSELKSELKPTADTQQTSPAMEREIKTLRYKYLAGKLAGEELLDNKGQVIIRKNQLITPDVVDAAEREGKLADLIVNMTIPGMEEGV